MKAKTLSALKKRIKITAQGKLLRRTSGKSHLLSSKSKKRKRRLSKPQVVSKSFEKNFRRLLPGT
ncbi:MAG: 50S ribosomal protein L35 [candidate division WOR-3 bacterium]|nr:50S ribosomal protein L35 [candidate division WOR-3 bacterium]MCX7757257.1 50S ribosomal protein L35 [candidate division WOR-3 bacterium]MDW7987711.1 50S ribosomal protein L35 [candidate division WOR-3 bacterium]